jgi:predicted site-specific integrase-resolvase
MYVPLQKIKRRYGVSSGTLRRWADSGKIKSIRSPGGHRLFELPDDELVEEKVPTRRPGDVVVYIRVSSGKQKDDLERQRAYMLDRRPGSRVVKDVASGINWKRPGLLSILDGAVDGTVKEVVVASRDRLSRLGFDILEWMLRRHGCALTVLQSVDQSPEDELSDDLLSIVQVFCCRRNGKRRYAVPAKGGDARPPAKRQTESDDDPKEAAQAV